VDGDAVTLVKRGRYYSMDFWYRGVRYQRTTGQELKEDAEQVERDLKRQLRREAHGIATIDRTQTPSFTAWAERFLVEKRKKLTRPDVLERTVRMVLAFWGAKPSVPVAGGVYKDLRLADPILAPELIDDFDDWMAVRGLSGSARNSYRSALSGMYKLALRPRWRRRTRIDSNPFEHIDRDTPRKRRVTATVEDMLRWIRAAAPHARLALTIGALAPKLRLAQVLSLRFDEHMDRDLTTFTFERHKTRRHTGSDQVTAIPVDLRAVLLAVRQAHPASTHVITYRGEPIQSIRKAAKTAATKAGLVYGLSGVTFHALRHVMGAECARLGINEVLAAATLGHKDPRTTRQHYQHILPADQRAVAEQLAQHLGLGAELAASVETAAGTRAHTAADGGGFRATVRRFRRA
jgi:integrase